MTKADGERYEGNYDEGVPNGYGVKTFPNGDKYEGEWLND